MQHFEIFIFCSDKFLKGFVFKFESPPPITHTLPISHTPQPPCTPPVLIRVMSAYIPYEITIILLKLAFPGTTGVSLVRRYLFWPRGRAGAPPPQECLSALGTRSDFCAFPLSLYRILSVDLFCRIKYPDYWLGDRAKSSHSFPPFFLL